jgi:pilus assembly protein CpaB
MRRFSRRRPTGWFAIATICAALAALLTVRAAATQSATAQVLVAARPLSVGTRLDRPEQVLASVAVPAAGVLPGMYVRAEQLQGRVIVVPVAQGEPVTDAALGGAPGVGPEPLRDGQRAVSVPALAAGAAAVVLVPGVRVDVVASPTDGATEARVVVSDAEVLARTVPPGADDGAAEGGAVLLRVGERDALLLSAALDLGPGVRLLPRPASRAEGTTP